MSARTAAPSRRPGTSSRPSTQIQIPALIRARPHLRTVRVGGRRSLRFRAEWIDEWLEATVSG